MLLARQGSTVHVDAMVTVDEAKAAAIRKAYLESGELSAVVELRRHFPGIADNENARRYVCAIASWQPLPALPPKKPRACRDPIIARWSVMEPASKPSLSFRA